MTAGSVDDAFRRFLGFEEPPARVSSGLLEAAPTLHFGSSLPPGPELEAARTGAGEDLAGSASQLAPLLVELRGASRGGMTPYSSFPSISVPAGTGVTDPEAYDDALRAFSNDAKIEYLAGLTRAGPPGTEDVDAATTQRALALTSAVFDATIAHTVSD